ncbi:MAG: polyamine ABC transporter substrate-binding protein [Pseudomonadales bacterium]
MKKILSLFILFLWSSVVFSDELKVYIWEDYISQELLDKWEEKTGHKVNLVFYDSDESRDEVLGSGNGKGFDLAVFDSISAQLFGKNNKLLALSPGNVPSLIDTDPHWKESCGNFGLPYLWGSLGIIYNKEKVIPAPTSWRHLLYPEQKYQGHVVMVEDAIDTLVAPLLLEGKSINTEDKSELQAAFTHLKNQAPSLLGYGYALTYEKQNEGQMYMALGYSGDQLSLNEMSQSEAWGFVYPKEGTAIWMDCFSVMKWSSKKELALEFIEFINQPSNAALNSEWLGLATPNKRALKQLPEDVLSDTNIYPTKEIINNSHSYRIISDANMTQRHRIINAAKKYSDSQ